jgi:hypothetical protein
VVTELAFRSSSAILRQIRQIISNTNARGRAVIGGSVVGAA